jgi:DNA-binding CsgD family transcriptional regulator
MYLSKDLNDIASASTSVIWMSWIFTSSFQLSGLKEIFGMSETRICFVEKSIIVAGWLAGTLLALLFPQTEWRAAIATVLAYCGLVWGIGANQKTVYDRRENELVNELTEQHRDARSRIIDTIALKYNLTDREREVAELLSEGYTRPVICSTLSISSGTARGHISHVYQKMGIHSKDELISLVNSVDEK